MTKIGTLGTRSARPSSRRASAAAAIAAHMKRVRAGMPNTMRPRKRSHATVEIWKTIDSEPRTRKTTPKDETRMPRTF